MLKYSKLKIEDFLRAEIMEVVSVYRYKLQIAWPDSCLFCYPVIILYYNLDLSVCLSVPHLFRRLRADLDQTWQDGCFFFFRVSSAPYNFKWFSPYL